MKDYSQEIAEIVRDEMDSLGTNYRWDEENGVFFYDMPLEGRFRYVNCIITVRSDSFSGYAICPLSAQTSEPSQMAGMAEFTARANYGLNRGNFEFDFRDGEIRCRNTIDCDGVTPSTDMVHNALFVPVTLLERYGDGIAKVLLGLQTPKAAIQECEA